MNAKAKAKAITAGAIALTLALGGGSLWAGQAVFAASSSDKQLAQSTQAENGKAGKDHAGKRGGFGRGFEQIQTQLLEYLGLEESALQTKLKTLTLSEIAVEQGKTRAELKTKLVEWLEAAEAAATTDTEAAAASDADKAAKPDAATTAEKLLDSKGFGFGKHGGGGKGGGFGKDLTAVAAALGVTEEALKAELEAGKTIAAVAAEKGVAVQTLIDLQVKDQKTKLAEQLAAGTITQEQYDTRFAEAVERATQHVNGVLPQRGKGQGFGKNLDEIASALGFTAEELKVELEAGKTIAAVAAEKGVAVQTLIDLQVKDQKTKLAELLAAGTITQEQYDTKLAAAIEHATKHVNGELPLSGKGGKGPRGERKGDAAAQEQTNADASEESAI
ncbi:SHOCT domain-containing protein [Paenibacillus sp. LHD-38]|uniref:SHOCT domain-containing protein n=1 Tax=Paenibacillus sp. LHD-38 TaxID=3072143 RepID=UPI00280C6B6D|nr:SHOCT domain-containing protein [Paenibacillus sp. LHD-38]MDQ8734168.1 SHOCT domain-containing protein [Paenibacillus sp. LHD-38]